MEISIKEDNLTVSISLDKDASCKDAVSAALDVISRIYVGADLKTVVSKIEKEL